MIAALLGCGSGGDSGGDSGMPSFSPIEPSPPAPSDGNLYFPPIGESDWESISLNTLNWNESALQTLRKVLEDNGTRGFIVLKNGRIVIEEYFGRTLNGENLFNETSQWYWASAGKTLTSFMVGKAQEDNFLSIEDRTSDYLGSGWTSATSMQEDAITVRHQLSMITGLDDSVQDEDCTLSACLLYIAEPETRWAYHNAPYTLLTQVVENAAGIRFSEYFNEQLKDKIGMNGFWFNSADSFNLTYYSSARSMARFGLLILNNGVWDEEVIMQDAEYFTAMVNSSQAINPSYGYLWWLNGKSSFMVPATGQRVWEGSLTPDAPDDMIAAIGRDGQLINIVPSEKLVIVRMGTSEDNTRIAVNVQNEIWKHLLPVIR